MISESNYYRVVSDNIPEKISKIRDQIANFAIQYQRPPDSVKLLAVSKTHPVEKILQASAAGQHAFGENYLQEALEKITALQAHALEWHFIGPIQSNKTRAIAENFSWVHSLDRIKIARRLSDQRPESLKALKVLIQVNLDGESSKAGVSLQALDTLALELAELPNIELAGLMAIPAPKIDFTEQRKTFQQLAQARDALMAKGLDSCCELSMGMSGDFEAAIAEGATIVRIGTDIFGPRNVQSQT